MLPERIPTDIADYLNRYNINSKPPTARPRAVGSTPTRPTNTIKHLRRPYPASISHKTCFRSVSENWTAALSCISTASFEFFDHTGFQPAKRTSPIPVRGWGAIVWGSSSAQFTGLIGELRFPSSPGGYQTHARIGHNEYSLIPP